VYGTRVIRGGAAIPPARGKTVWAFVARGPWVPCRGPHDGHRPAHRGTPKHPTVPPGRRRSPRWCQGRAKDVSFSMVVTTVCREENRSGAPGPTTKWPKRRESLPSTPKKARGSFAPNSAGAAFRSPRPPSAGARLVAGPSSGTIRALNAPSAARHSLTRFGRCCGRQPQSPETRSTSPARLSSCTGARISMRWTSSRSSSSRPGSRSTGQKKRWV